MLPDVEDGKVDGKPAGAYVGKTGEDVFVNKISGKTHFDWMNKKKPETVKHIEPGQHIKVKPREDVRYGYKRFIDLCKRMGLTPSTMK